MQKIIIQIYELQNRQQAEMMVELGVDRVGSVILSKRDWKVPEIREIGRFLKTTKTHHSLIPLFCDKETVFRVIDYYESTFIHFCESLVSLNGETALLAKAVELQIQVKKRFPHIQITRSIPISPLGHRKIPTFEIAKALEESSDYFLTDTWLGKEPVDGFIGITGQICNWNTAKLLVKSSPIPVILAGGMSPENVYNGIRMVKPYGVDSCTQTNKMDGNNNPIRFNKDIDRVRRFVLEVHRAQQDLITESMPREKSHEQYD